MQHRRRRYRGTHPRTFAEKYKELDPDRFPEEADRVRSRGQTPAGTHVPVLLAEVLEVLAPRPGQVYLDCTLGYGGHAEAVARRILPDGIALGMDIDPETLARTSERLAVHGVAIRTHRGNFAGVGKVLSAEGLDGVDLLLADLGVSSMQLDDPERGFSLKDDGRLDLRLDRSRGVPAAAWLLDQEEEALAAALARWGDEPDARRIAAAIRARTLQCEEPLRTRELARIVLAAKGISRRYRQSSAFEAHPAARTFQALRIALNREEENLAQLLRLLPFVLRPGGRAAIISFHEGEDRLVGEALEEGVRAGHYARESPDPIRPAREEVRANPRARSARLRWAERASPIPPRP